MELKSISKEDSSSRASLRRASGPKPWKSKRAAVASSTSDTVEIFETKAPIVDFGLKATPVNRYIRVGCQGHGQFIVPLEVVKSFQAVETAFEDDGIFKESVENYIQFPDISYEVLEMVIRFAFTEYIHRLKDISMFGQSAPRTIFQFEVDPGMAMELISAAHFLGQEGLLSLCTMMVARHISDVPDLSTLPLQIAECIAEQLTPQDLLVAEERDDFKSLQLDVEPIWKKHCLKLGDNLLYSPESQVETLALPLPPSWKCAYVTYLLQRLADRQIGDGNEEFLRELSRWGRYATIHTVYLPLWESVIQPMGPGGLLSYMANMSNLTSLLLQPGLPLGVSPDPGEEPCLDLGEALLSLPKLQVLQAIDVGLYPEAASRLGAALALHTSLQVLRLAENQIGSQGLAEILRSLPKTRSLRVLDVSNNGVEFAIAEDAVSALAESSLEELLNDGFEDTVLSRAAWTTRMERTIRPMWAHEGAPDSSGLVIPLLSRFPPCLRKLSMRSRNMSEGQTRILFQALDSHSSIEVIELGDNNLTGRSASVIFTWLKKNASLKTLGLDHNCIDDACTGTLIDALSAHPNLTKLNLLGNYSFGEDRFIELIEAAIQHSELMHKQTPNQEFEMNLRGTGIRDGARRGAAARANGTHLQLLF